MCNSYNISVITFTGRVRNNWSLESALTTPDTVKSIRTDHLGKSFKSTQQMCDDWGVSVKAFNRRIKKGWSVEDALTKDNTLQYEDHTGKKFKSQLEMCKYHGVAFSTFRHRIERGWSLEKALDPGEHIRLGCRVEFLGTEYGSLKELIQKLRINVMQGTIYCRLRIVGVELEVALILEESNYDLKPIFINLDGVAYYNVPWSLDPVSTRQIIEHYRPDLLEAYDKSNPTGEYRPYE